MTFVSTVLALLVWSALVVSYVHPIVSFRGVPAFTPPNSWSSQRTGGSSKSVPLESLYESDPMRTSYWSLHGGCIKRVERVVAYPPPPEEYHFSLEFLGFAYKTYDVPGRVRSYGFPTMQFPVPPASSKGTENVPPDPRGSPPWPAPSTYGDPNNIPPDVPSIPVKKSLHYLQIPIWLPAILISIYPAIVWRNHFSTTGRQKRRRERSLCIHCAYDLTGNTSGLCPECGHPIIPPSAPEP